MYESHEALFKGGQLNREMGGLVHSVLLLLVALAQKHASPAFGKGPSLGTHSGWFSFFPGGVLTMDSTQLSARLPIMLPAPHLSCAWGVEVGVIWGHVRFEMVPWDLTYLRGSGETLRGLFKEELVD